MDLLEYQAKDLFQQRGIPVLPSQQICQPKDLKGLKIPYPIVLKSQVYTGGRSKAGGIRFVENTIDAVAAAQAIFHLPIMGQYPEVLLAEARYQPDRELYLAVVLDRSSRRPLLLGSQEGGVEVERVVGQMKQVIVDQEFSPFYARRLALQMGLQGELIQTVSDVVEKMYHLFLEKDLDLVEINPLAVSSTGEIMALDGKVIANNDALGRHPDLVTLDHQLPISGRTRISGVVPTAMNLVELDGSIGLLCNGGALTMATLDLVYRAGGKPANYLNVGGEFSHSLPPDTLPERVRQGLEVLSRDRGARVVLLNILSSVVGCDEVARAIAAQWRRRTVGHRPQLVVRLTGSKLELARELLRGLEIGVVDNLDEAIAQAVSLSKSKVA